MAWVYYRPSEQGPWEVAHAENDQHVLDRAAHRTMLEVKEQVRDGVANSDIQYRGDLWMDLDGKSIHDAIQDLHALLHTLPSLDVRPDWVRIFATGGRGFHVCIPAHVFGKGNRFEKHLNLVYGRLAGIIAGMAGITTLDEGLYAGGKGHMIRVENQVRPNGSFKVPLSWDEAINITEIEYRNLTAAPRAHAFPALPDGALANKLAGMFEEAKADVKAWLKARKGIQVVSDTLLDVYSDGDHPACVARMREWQGTNPGVNWNDVEMQYAIYVSKSGKLSQSERELLIRDFSNNSQSSAYPDTQARDRHLRGLIHSVSGYGFSCEAIRRCLVGSPCAGCKLKEAAVAQAMHSFNISVIDGGYWIVENGEPVRKLTNFTLNWEVQYLPDDVSGVAEEHFDGGEFQVVREGQGIATLKMPSNIWNDQRKFKEQFSNLRSTQIFCTDNDLQNLKSFIDETQRGYPRMVRFHNFVGIHRDANDDPDDPKEVYYWLEPDHAMNRWGTIGSHTYMGEPLTVYPMTRLSLDKIDPTDVWKVIPPLLGSNSERVIAQVVGWCIAANFKTHLFQDITKQFPHLSLFGLTSSGKTSAARVYSALTGADYRVESGTSANATTPHPLRNMVCSVSTVARILDEVDRAKIKNHSQWNFVQEIIKQSYQHGTMEMGTRAKGNTVDRRSAGVIQFTAKAPLILTSTQEFEDKELHNRSVNVRMLPGESRSFGRSDQFRALQERLNTLRTFKLARLFIQKALEMSAKEAFARLDACEKELPPALTDSRYILSTAIPLFGLSILRDTSLQYEFPQEVLDRIDVVKGKYLDYLHDKYAPGTYHDLKTEVDLVMETLASLTQVVEHGEPLVKSGHHYVLDTPFLHVHSSRCYYAYADRQRRIGGRIEYTSEKSFMDALKLEPYFGGSSMSPELNNGYWHQLDVDILRRRGLNLASFGA